MIVVSDASALIVLVNLNQLDILHTLFKNVFIPPEVHRELAQQTGNIGIEETLASASGWLHIQSPQAQKQYQGLHPGETAAIALARELKADFLIIDEKAGRRIAAREKVQTIGTIGVLEIAADAGLIDLATTFVQLKLLKFHVTQRLLDDRLKAFEQRQELKSQSERRTLMPEQPIDEQQA